MKPNNKYFLLILYMFEPIFVRVWFKFWNCINSRVVVYANIAELTENTEKLRAEIFITYKIFVLILIIIFSKRSIFKRLKNRILYLIIHHFQKIK